MDLQRWRWFLGELLVIVTPKSCWYAISMLDFWGIQTKPILYGRSSLNWWKKKKGHTNTSAHFFSISTSKRIPQSVLSLSVFPLNCQMAFQLHCVWLLITIAMFWVEFKKREDLKKKKKERGKEIVTRYDWCCVCFIFHSLYNIYMRNS